MKSKKFPYKQMAPGYLAQWDMHNYAAAFEYSVSALGYLS